MPKANYSFRPQARTDAVEIAVYIAKDNKTSAQAFLAALEKTCKQISLMPKIGSSRFYSHPLLKEMRMFPIGGFPGYLIFYLPIKKGVEVVRILHTARDLPDLFD